MESGSGISTMADERVEGWPGQLRMAISAFKQAFVGRARVVTSSTRECDI